GTGLVRARDRPRAGLLRGPLQPWEHLPRPRSVRRSAGLLSRGAEAESLLRRRTFLPGGHLRENGPLTGGAPALARLSTARAAGRVGRAREGIFGVINTCNRQASASSACVGA